MICWKLFIASLISLSFCGKFKLQAASLKESQTPTNITTKNFQLDFINEIRDFAEQRAAIYLNAYLHELETSTKSIEVMYAKEFQETENSSKLDEKILLIKQILDVKNIADTEAMMSVIRPEDFYALRNVIFLKKLKHKLHHVQEESEHELRQLRMYALCKQFLPTNSSSSSNSPRQARAEFYSKQQQNDGLQHQQQKISIDITEFGRKLYANVNHAGAEVIDDYLNNIRELLQGVIEDKAEHEHHTVELSKLLKEIDRILAIEDFYEKRQQLYDYLQNNLGTDYEQFKQAEHAQEDLAEILKRLHQRGLDLFFNFLLSNFEFLEHLHAEWLKLLPRIANAAAVVYEGDTKLLYDIHTLYEQFKADAENNEKYLAYMEHVKKLHEQTLQSTGNSHIFELLHNASQNLGSITMNMIQAKCNEI